MKHLCNLTALILCALIICTCLPSCGKTKLEQPITFMIANDLHYLSPSLLGNGEFFSIPKSNADGKLVHYSSEIADALIAEVLEKEPQALILAGDITLNGSYASHTELFAKLKVIKDAGIDLLIIPGNHDIDSTAVDYSGEELTRADSIDSAEFAELYSPLIPERAISRDTSSMSYIYEATDRLRIVMLDTNTFGQGFVKDQTLVWLEDELKKAAEAGADVISVSHQNLYAHSELLSFGYQLYNADELLALYEKYGVQANFSGHIHIQSIEDRGIPEITTSSVSITGLQYGELIYDGRGIDYSVCSLEITAEGIEDFSTYALDYFEDIAIEQAREALADSNLSNDEIMLMAETYARINSSYFTGKKFKGSEYTSGIELWRSKSNSFISKYIDSMLKEQNGNQSIKIKFK